MVSGDGFEPSSEHYKCSALTTGRTGYEIAGLPPAMPGSHRRGLFPGVYTYWMAQPPSHQKGGRLRVDDPK